MSERFRCWLIPALLLVASACAHTPLPGADEGRMPLPDGSVYQGEFEDGLRQGRGVLTWGNGTTYTGDFRRGLMHGKGKLVSKNGDVYEGEFREGSFHGHGRWTSRNGDRYVGDFAEGYFDGKGEYTRPNGDRYSGDFKDGDFHGTGVFEWANGSSYRGEVEDDLYQGHGVLRYEDGSTYTGQFAAGEFQGEGVFVGPTGDEYRGTFVHGELTGKGRHFSGGVLVYSGDFKSWLYHGEGTLLLPDGQQYVGEFRDGSFHGRGRLTNPDGDVYEGEFSEGLFHGNGKLTYANPAGRVTSIEGIWEGGLFQGDLPSAAVEAPPLDLEGLLYRQPLLLSQALERVAASRPGVPDLYFVGFGSDASQDVFMKEVLFADRLFQRDFGTRDRSIALINNRETAEAIPLATVTNLRETLDALASRMDLEQDILFLFLTSHGSREHGVSVTLGGFPLNALPAEALAEMLETAGIRWKVVVVSSCYSGRFIEPLRDDHTMILTASSAEKRSFGCSDEADFTYFGGAFFRDSIPREETFAKAFARAKERIAELENQSDYDHSDPQIWSSEPIERKLAEWRRTLASTPGALADDPAAPPDG